MAALAFAKKLEILAIAKVAHETNRAYCQSIGDFSQPQFGDAPDWQVQSAINGVRFHVANPDAGPAASHESWLDEKRKAGWTWGQVKDPDKKEHPCMVVYDDLPAEQRVKDALFISVVNAMKVLL